MAFGKFPKKGSECDDDDETEIKRRLLERAKRREELRNEFLKQKSDPFRHSLGEGGTVFDAAIQRYHSMKGSQFEYFKPTFSNAFIGIFLMVIPMVGYAYLLHSSREGYEKKYRSGLVAYKDRMKKFI